MRRLKEERLNIHRVTDNDIGGIYGCYKIIGIADDRRTPGGQVKKYYLCQCNNCGSVKELNTYKVRNNNYQYCNNCKPKQKEISNMLDRKFGRLTVVGRADNNIQPSGGTKVIWKCKCDCGNEVNVMDEHLKSGHTQSCGCYHSERTRECLVRDLVGKKFGKLTPYKKAYVKNGRQYWYCLCDCKNTCIVSSVSLTSGKRKSCGCLVSTAEYELEQHLKQTHINYRTQYKFDDCKDQRCLPFDFVLFDDDKNIIMAVELNGEQHYHPFTYCGEDKDIKISNLKDRQKKDKIKREYCIRNNIPLLEIRYTKFYKKEQLFDDFYQKIIGG